MSAQILSFPGVKTTDDRWSLEAARKREGFAGLVDRMARRWPTLSREEAEVKCHAMTLQLARRLSDAGLD